MRQLSGGRQEEVREQTHLSISTGRVKCLNLKCGCKDRICGGTDGKASCSPTGPTLPMALATHR